MGNKNYGQKVIGYNVIENIIKIQIIQFYKDMKLKNRKSLPNNHFHSNLK